MTRINEKNVFSIAIFLFGLLIFSATLELRNDIALIPKIMSICLVLFSGWQMVYDLFPGIKERLKKKEKKEQILQNDTVARVEDEREEKEIVKKRYLFIGWMILFISLVYVTSMIWGILISMFLYLKWISGESWKMTVLYSAGVTLFIYLTFVVGFEIYYFL
ncbi:tripartite tricarboxylate transporter TctB family protein [Domibacillus epiphyticus]|uniref:DUF1468 domain-containing protein n=1 Tax=Domibacillus epiphyticus TaxID=1714355 RepID=A0A1V2A3Z0_9BACI|nr:tripartite tricarboxylate transporter TctB family protein [Domibacillus epiphyticus]OMP65719.1 hypothetical protein BTO28_15750 [Domibacillus epiphyticus]